MTPHTIVGLVLLVLGVAVKVAAAATWLPGDVSFIGEITNLGVLLLGKELLPGSAAAIAKRNSKRPPPIPALLVLSALLLGGCGTDYRPDDARAAASRMRADLAEVRGILSGAEGGVQLLCAVRANTEECSTATDIVRVLSAALKTASQSVDLIDATGIAVDAVQPQVSNVLVQARALGETLRVMGSEVANAVASNQAPNAGGGDPPLGPLLPQPAEGSGEPAPPASAPAP